MLGCCGVCIVLVAVGGSLGCVCGMSGCDRSTVLYVTVFDGSLLSVAWLKDVSTVVWVARLVVESLVIVVVIARFSIGSVVVVVVAGCVVCRCACLICHANHE